MITAPIPAARAAISLRMTIIASAALATPIQAERPPRTASGTTVAMMMAPGSAYSAALRKGVNGTRLMIQ